MEVINLAPHLHLRQAHLRHSTKHTTHPSNQHRQARYRPQATLSPQAAAKRSVLLSSTGLARCWLGHVTKLTSFGSSACADVLRRVRVQQQPINGRPQCSVPSWVQRDFCWNWFSSPPARSGGRQAKRLLFRNSVRDNVPGSEIKRRAIVSLTTITARSTPPRRAHGGGLYGIGLSRVHWCRLSGIRQTVF